MSETNQRRRVLLAASASAQDQYRSLFQSEALHGWDLLEADSLERTRFLLQLDPCEVLLLDCSVYQGGKEDELSWLTGQRRAPVLLVADDTEAATEALRRGVQYWLPRELARRHAPVLAAMLRQASEFGEVQRRGQETNEALEDARRQVSRLVNLLWEAVPGEGRSRWFTQRHMLERLEEEVIRTQRYGGPLALILGEVEVAPALRSASGEAGQTATWIVDHISRVKRRSDVAGQYGLQGFILLLPQTDAAGAAGCCRRLQAILQKPESENDVFGSFKVHFGIACYSSEARSVKSLLSRAEEQLECGRTPV